MAALRRVCVWGGGAVSQQVCARTCAGVVVAGGGPWGERGRRLAATRWGGRREVGGVRVFLCGFAGFAGAPPRQRQPPTGGQQNQGSREQQERAALPSPQLRRLHHALGGDVEGLGHLDEVWEDVLGVARHLVLALLHRGTQAGGTAAWEGACWGRSGGTDARELGSWCGGTRPLGGRSTPEGGMGVLTFLPRYVCARFAL